MEMRIVMVTKKPQKPGPPPVPGFSPGALLEGWRGASHVRDLAFSGRLRTALDFAAQACSRGITAGEYFDQFRFHTLPKAGQERFITLYEAQRITWRLSREIRDVFWNKDLFLEAFSGFVRRGWVRVTEGRQEDFRALCGRNARLIVKPRASTEGRGIRILEKDETAEPDALFRELLGEDCIVEEIIQSDGQMAAFNPSSLNTVRIVTLYNGEHFEVFGAVVRFGRAGSPVDNVSAGGLFAALDPVTGEIITHGMDKEGHRWPDHPDSGRAFLGFRIPRWDRVLDTVKDAVKVRPNIRIAGWDVALTREGDIELVEGNHMPDFDLLQQPRQMGVKQAFEEKVRVLFGDRFLDNDMEGKR